MNVAMWMETYKLEGLPLSIDSGTLHRVHYVMGTKLPENLSLASIYSQNSMQRSLAWQTL